MSDLITASPTDLDEILTKAFQHKKPHMIVGAPGIGKTQIVEQVTRKLNYDLIPMYPAVSEAVDFKGLPIYDRERRVATFEPFDVLNDLIKADRPTVCLIDDFGHAMLSTMAATMHMFSARRIGDHKISDHVTFVLCTNDKTHHAGVTGIIEPVKSRMTSIVYLSVDLEDGIEWAIANNIRPEVIGFIRLRGMQMLSNFKPTMDLTNSPSPRGNQAVSDILNMDYSERVETIEIQGAVGRGYAVEMHGFRRLCRSLVDPMQIIRDPDSVQIPDRDPSILYAYCSALSSLAQPKYMDSIVQFARRLAIEFQIKLLEYDCKSANPENHETGAYTKWAIDNQHITKAA